MFDECGRVIHLVIRTSISRLSRLLFSQQCYQIVINMILLCHNRLQTISVRLSFTWRGAEDRPGFRELRTTILLLESECVYEYRFVYITKYR